MSALQFSWKKHIGDGVKVHELAQSCFTQLDWVVLEHIYVKQQAEIAETFLSDKMFSLANFQSRIIIIGLTKCQTTCLLIESVN